MEPTQLQLVLNVVCITGATSLAGFCYLLKKENRKLATELKVVRGVPPVASAKALVKSPVASVPQDIRQFASARRTGWVNNITSALSC
jgi:hypothetical protein